MTTPVSFIGFQEGFYSPIFGLSTASTFIVIIDATGLRRQVGFHDSMQQR
jgi:acid phosphatase family membrane protein YuiD